MMKNRYLKQIITKSKKYIYGELLGNHNSKNIGDGYDFAQIREYEYGENIRRIDPFASAKTGKIHLRSFYESKDLNIHVIALMSGTMFFGTKELKQNIVAQVAALLGLSCAKNSDSFTLSIFNKKLQYQSARTKRENGVIEEVQKILNYNAIGQSIDYYVLNKYLLSGIKKRSVIFLVGDFYEIPNLKVVSKKHEIILVRVRDNFELSPENIGEIGIIDPSTLKQIDINLSSANIKEHKKRVHNFDVKFGSYLKHNNIKFIDILTSDNVYMKFITFFKGL